jgi:hypothetical protein
MVLSVPGTQHPLYTKYNVDSASRVDDVRTVVWKPQRLRPTYVTTYNRRLRHYLLMTYELCVYHDMIFPS